MQNQLRRSLVNLLVLGIVNCFSLAGPARGDESIKFALPGNSMGYLPLFVAVHRGFFKDEGLEIELPRFIPAIAQNALLAGEVQYHGLADSGLRLAARGLPIKAIFYGADRPMYYLVAQKEIRSVPELRGKRIGVSQFGGTSDLAARLALKHFGVEPEKDALLIQIGAEGTRMAALRAGSVSAIIVPVPAVAILRR
ncbi:MAG TPA: ABC transporter substrate-binding protein, partial [Candidatus Binatia bacterium]|nr:ABC transporter substrate-binding protein [Candidatus Binatia bacterium]